MGTCRSKAARPGDRPPQSWKRSNQAATDPDGDSYVDLISLALQRSAAFQSWSIGHIRQLAGNTTERDFYDMEPIFKEGEESDGIYFVKTGKVEISSSVQGSMELLARSSLFGEKDVTAKQKRSHAAIARGALTTILRISRADYHQITVSKNAVTELPTFATLRDSTILMGLTEAQLVTLHSHCELEQYAPNEVIFKRLGPATEKLYIVHKGFVTVTEIASAYDINSLWKLEWIGLNTYVTIGKTGYFGDSANDAAGIESSPVSAAANGSGSDPQSQPQQQQVSMGHTVTATAGAKGAAVLSISRTPLISKAELRGVLERIVLNIQIRDQELRRNKQERPLDCWLAKVGQQVPGQPLTPLGI